MNEQQLGIDFAVILGAVVGAMLRSGQTPEDIRSQVDDALMMAIAFSVPNHAELR